MNKDEFITKHLPNYHGSIQGFLKDIDEMVIKERSEAFESARTDVWGNSIFTLPDGMCVPKLMEYTDLEDYLKNVDA